MVCYEFSAAYMLCDVQPVEWPQDHAVVSDDTYSRMIESVYWSCDMAPRDLHVKVGRKLYHLESEASVPTDMIAVPEDAVDGEESDEVYVLKPRFVNYLKQSGYIGNYDW